MPLYGGVWYRGCAATASSASSGLWIPPPHVASMAAGAPGVPVTWEHSAVPAIQSAPPGRERQAAASHGRSIGRVVASWVDRDGAARVVFRVDGRNVVGLLDTGILSSLSATHVVGTPTMLELSLTRTPARPLCDIDGRIPTVAAYIARHPPAVTAARP